VKAIVATPGSLTATEKPTYCSFCTLFSPSDGIAETDVDVRRHHGSAAGLGGQHCWTSRQRAILEDGSFTVAAESAPQIVDASARLPDRL